MIQRVVNAWNAARTNKPLLVSPHFALAEFGSRDGAVVPPELLANVRALCAQLEILREHLGRPIRITSGYRTPTHNARVKGAKTSQHIFGKAADITVAGIPPAELANVIELLIARGRMHDGGLGRYRAWVHYDVRPARARWHG
jgi:uncharacterized protein YcbK (DUF882 family)